MSSYAAPHQPKKGRNVDRESRKSRVQAPPPPELSDEESLVTASEVEDTPLPVVKKSESGRFPTGQKKSKSRSSRPVQKPIEEPASAEEEVEEDKVVSSTSFLLAASLHVSPQVVTSFEDNKFIPDFHAFFYVLFQMQSSVYQNEYFKRLVPGYCSLVTSIYYSILLLFQVCRSRVAANVASKSESQFARRFEREFPLESLPVASPLLGFFEVLGYVCPSKYFEYVSPQLPLLSDLTQANNFLRRDVVGLSRIPLVPAMLALVVNIRANASVALKEQTGTIYWTVAKTNVYGLRFGTAAEYTKLVTSAGWLPVLADVYDDASFATLRAQLSRLGLPVAPASLTTVSNFCGLTDDASWSWFRRFAVIAGHEAGFFSNPSNMSAISPAGTPSMLIEVYSPWNPTAFAYDDDDIDNFYFGSHNLAFADQVVDAYQRYGNDEEFRAGTVTQFLTGYKNVVGHRRRWKDGDWFNNAGDNFAANPPVIRPTLPIAKFILASDNPLHLTDQIVKETLYKVEGQKRK